ncbi:MAG: right-handed parallel beta-helix repeat-containing protein [Prevotella sp.]|nr:right-handed parallel beta-helix repeat-containing protein [Prevotella sp.]
MKRIFLYLVILTAVMIACSEDDSFTTSRSYLLTFSEDTVKMDTVFSNVSSSTYTFWVYNYSGDGIKLSSVRLRNGNQTGFRVNVDGSYLDNTLGSVVNDLEVRKGDSIRVFVELTSNENGSPEPQLVEDDLVFSLESGAEQRVHLCSYSWDALKFTDLVVSRDTVLEWSAPVVFYGQGIQVDSGAVLTLRNSVLYFHDKAGIRVHGSLKTENVILRGDRLDHMFSYLPYDRVSGQWAGIVFEPSAVNNILTDTEIRNATTAVDLREPATLDSLNQRLTMTRCIVHNAKGGGVVSTNSNVGLYGCQLTNTLGDCLALYGGIANVDHCTLAQFYPFDAARGAALVFSNSYDDKVYSLSRLSCSNTIVTGYDADVVMVYRTDSAGIDLSYQFYDCLLRTPAVEDDTISFKRIQWETPKDSIQGKQHFVLVDEDNLIYNFHLDSLSTAQGKGCY